MYACRGSVSCTDGYKTVVGCVLSGRRWLTVGEKTSHPRGVLILVLIFCRFSMVSLFCMSPSALLRVRNLSIAKKTIVSERWKTL